MIEFCAEDVRLPEVCNQQTKAWIERVVSSFDKKVGILTYVFCSDAYILEVNRNYLQHNYYTDIITFDYCKNQTIAGDLVISVDTVRSNSQLFNRPFEEELHRVIIHGILHLLGFKDATEEEKLEMRRQEDRALSILSTFH
ncbi:MULTISPECIES: rRNA maturation RNase YbeY [unclassified Carboxylicivirga]|uniref:rRNA maturation RNase YbeY n=1 Tax=Carboxylicivirga TaxID=1628153 RepID=UPI003D33D6F8